MSEDSVIKNFDELEYAVFCIENVAIKLKKNPEDVYRDLTEKSDILYGYIVPTYDVMHTQGKDYIVNDIIEIMEKRGLEI